MRELRRLTVRSGWPWIRMDGVPEIQPAVPRLGSAAPRYGLAAASVARRMLSPDGLGMGLSTSRSIILSHGGRLWATPNFGHGAIFQFVLPAWKERP